MAIFATYFHAFMDYGHTVTRGPLLLRTMNFYYYSQKAAKNFRFFQIFFFFFIQTAIYMTLYIWDLSRSGQSVQSYALV